MYLKQLGGNQFLFKTLFYHQPFILNCLPMPAKLTPTKLKRRLGLVSPIQRQKKKDTNGSLPFIGEARFGTTHGFFYVVVGEY